MNKHLIERFKNGEIAINLESQQEWDEFMQWLEENTDLKWTGSNNEPTTLKFWTEYEKDICVTSKISYSSASYYREEGYEIIKYKDLKEKQGMKTSELLKWLKERHINATETEYTITTHTGFTVYKDLVGVIKFHNSNTFDTEIVAKLVEYMDTPLEDREEEKKYYIRPKGMIVLGGASFSYNPYGEYWYLENDPFTDHMTTFTLKELEGLGIDVEHYDLVEVE